MITPEEKCAACKGPFHIVSGDLMGPKNTPICGACVHNFKEYVKGTMKKRYNKVNFSKHATVPPPAKIRQWRFITDKMARMGDTNVFQCISFIGRGVTFEEAAIHVKGLIPEGHRVFCNYEIIELTK